MEHARALDVRRRTGTPLGYRSLPALLLYLRGVRRPHGDHIRVCIRGRIHPDNGLFRSHLRNLNGVRPAVSGSDDFVRIYRTDEIEVFRHDFWRDCFPAVLLRHNRRSTKHGRRTGTSGWIARRLSVLAGPPPAGADRATDRDELQRLEAEPCKKEV